MKKIGILVAMQSEYDLVKTLFDNPEACRMGEWSFLSGTIAGVEVVLGKSGIGKVSAAVGTVEMIRRYAPDALLSTGVAGGIALGLRVMDVVIGKEMVYHDVWCGEGNAYGQVQGLPPRFEADPRLLQCALSLAEEERRFIAGLICTGDQFITDHQSLSRIKEHFPEGVAVDMESCAIAQVCHTYKVPFLSYRLISDTPGVEAHARQYRNFWEEAPRHSFELLRQLIATFNLS